MIILNISSVTSSVIINFNVQSTAIHPMTTPSAQSDGVIMLPQIHNNKSKNLDHITISTFSIQNNDKYDDKAAAVPNYLSVHPAPQRNKASTFPVLVAQRSMVNSGSEPTPILTLKSSLLPI
jgi:hypothetical protein